MYDAPEMCRETLFVTGPGEFVRTNVAGAFDVLDACRAYLASGYLPDSPYAASKAAYYKTYGVPTIVTNCSNNYGPRQFPEKLVPLMILNPLEGKPRPVYRDGLQARDGLYVEDPCEALRLVLDHSTRRKSSASAFAASATSA